MRSPQSTGWSPINAPKIVFTTITITQVGYFEYRIRMRNSNTYLARKSSQSLTAYLSLGFTDLLNCPTKYLSVLEAHP